MKWLSSIFVLLVFTGIRSAIVSDLKRQKRQDGNLDNTVIEVFNNCKCVYYYQCDNNNFVITNGETILEPRMKNNSTTIPCNGNFENEMICCKVNTTLQSEVKSPLIDEIYTDNQNNETNIYKGSKKIACGAQKTIINVRIFAGEDELTPIKGEFPWIAAIFKKTSSGQYKFHCSGSLIHPKVVLTANHCVHRKQPNATRVVVNGDIRLSAIGTNPEEERGVSEIIHHPNYYAGGLYNDAALLILNEPYISNKQNTLCLPPSDIQMNNVKCLVAGWGKDDQGESRRVMKKVELPFVEFNQCQEQLRNTRLGSLFNLHKSFMCAGGEKGKDACKGDGGSPLMCPYPSENRYFQIGIVSWGIGCGMANVPGVYANVLEFTDWIKGELENRQLTT